VELTLTLDPSLPTAPVDKVRIRLVLLNLIGSMRKACSISSAKPWAGKMVKYKYELFS
jgi:hypothetical protein